MATELQSLPACINLTLYRGDDWNEVFVYKIDDVAVNMSGGTCEAIFSSALNGAPLLTANATGSKLLCDGSGNITFALDPSDIALLGSRGVYEMRYTDSAGEIETLFAGRYVIEDDVAV